MEAILLPDKVRSVNAQRTLTIKVLSPQERESRRGSEGRGSTGDKETTCALVSVTNPDISPCLQSMQSFSTGAEKQRWRSSGCSLEGGVWMSVDDIPCLPKHFFQHYAKLTHGLDHVSKAGMIMQMRNYGLQRGLQWLLKFFAKDVSLVNTHNEARGIKTPLASQPAPAGHHSWA